MHENMPSAKSTDYTSVFNLRYTYRYTKVKTHAFNTTVWNVFSFNSSLDSDNHCKDTINHRAIGLISIPSSFEIANKNQVYHPEYLDPASCAILFLLGLASCGITKWAPTSHK